MYSESLTEEIQNIIFVNCLNCTIDDFKEYFMALFQDKVPWARISQDQKLSEEFIEKFQNKVRWGCISRYQKLSESFIEKFQDRVDWDFISIHQKLSEEFIEKLQNKVDWNFISKFQKLSESFIEKFQDKVNWELISKYQKLSPKFRKEYNIIINEDNWLYKSDEFKLKYIKENTDYEVVDNKYIIAYKGIRRDNYSKFNFQYKYEVGKIYESHCDCNINNENSFGLSAWNLKNAKIYCDEKIIKVKIEISDVGAIVKYENKIRCFKFEVVKYQ
jgi:hypothetical protein